MVEWSVLDERLFADVVACNQLILSVDSPFARRQFVRAIFALIEAGTFGIKKIVAGMHSDGDFALTTGELAVLREESFDLDNHGDVTSRPLRIPTVRNIRFALGILGRTAAPGFTVDFGNHGWEALQAALRVRHRLTHPKGVEDINVDDDDLAMARLGVDWFRRTLRGFAKAAADHHKAQFEALISESRRSDPDAPAG